MTRQIYPTRKSRSRCPHDRCQDPDAAGDPPTFEARRSDDGVSLYFTCPCCGWGNSHGACGPKHGEGDGHRGSHCRCWGRGYFIVETGPDYEERDRPGFERRRRQRESSQARLAADNALRATADLSGELKR